MNSSQYVGRYVVFTDEYGSARVGRVLMVDPYDWSGYLGIEGDYGLYCRKPEAVRLAEAHEVHQWEINGSLS